MSINKSLEHSKSFFLTTFLIPRRAKDYPIMEEHDWERLLGEDPWIITKQLEKDGLVKRASLAQHIDRKFTLDELKHIANEKGISVAGRKEELILRLVTSDSRKMWELASEENVFECSEKGLEVATQYLNGFSQDNKSLLQSLKITKEQLLIWVKWILAAAAAGVIGNRADDVLLKLSELIEHISLSPDIYEVTPTEPPTPRNNPSAVPDYFQRLVNPYSCIEENGMKFYFIDQVILGRLVNFAKMKEYEEGLVVSVRQADSNMFILFNFFVQLNPLTISNQLVFHTNLDSIPKVPSLMQIKIMVEPIPEVLFERGWKASAIMYSWCCSGVHGNYPLLLAKYFNGLMTEKEKTKFVDELGRIVIPVYSIEPIS